MVITRLSYQKLIDTLREDKDLGLELRFTTRVIFVNNLASYIRMIDDLQDMADEIIKLSDDAYCGGKDSVPDLKEVLKHISRSRDKNIVVTSVGEYLRFAKKYEADVKVLHSILTFPAHSRKRVWIPIYASKDIFQDVVGELPAERYELFELEEEADEFECFVYSDAFSEKSGIVAIQGLKQMFRAWDNLDVFSGMSFSTKKLSMVTPSTGNYAVYIIKSPFEYIQKNLKTPNPKLIESLGLDAFWTKLASFAVVSNGTMEDLLGRALNVGSFDAQQVVSGWGHLSENDGFGIWLLWLWYKLGLAASGDYLSFAIQRANTFKDVQIQIECAILACVTSPTFDDWVNERRNALQNMGITALSSEFWDEFESIEDERTKLKLLSNTTHEERTRIIEIISDALKKNKKLTDYKSLLLEKYPDLLLYFKESAYLSESLNEYFQAYKQFKIMDYYDLSISEAAYDVDSFEYDTRSTILNSIKCKKDAFFLWIDGMGIEWIDMLVEKVIERNPLLVNPDVTIGLAVVPTTTSANMAKADPETVSYKYNQFDSLSHIKDKSDCNYYSIVDKQFEMIAVIADMIVKTAANHPGKPIVVTADHGMSRMAAKAFHEKPGLTPPPGVEVENLGRYCVLPDGASPITYSHTYKEEKCLAFRDHSHFICSGYAPGEIHGGASPEEWLVPIIVFNNDQVKNNTPDLSATYNISSTLLKPDMAGNVVIKIKTTGEVKSLMVEQGINTFVGTSTTKGMWLVSIPMLTPGNKYDIRIHLNNVFSKKVETITVQRRGFDVDDDL